MNLGGVISFFLFKQVFDTAVTENLLMGYALSMVVAVIVGAFSSISDIINSGFF